MDFLKMEGLSNDFIITHGNSFASLEHIAKQSELICDRRKGIGGDGVILILPSQKADFEMRIFNSDGSEAEMCGNGIRCCAKYANSMNLSTKQSLTFETKAGLISTELLSNDLVRVTMSSPILEAVKIPTTQQTGLVIMHDLQVEDRHFKITAVSMGNPHAVIYADALTDELVLEWGKKIETNPFFPKRTNVEFVKVLSHHEIQMRVWERGCGETQACGTGACASVVAGIINKLHDASVIVHLLGGDLSISWEGDSKSPVYMTGPARTVFNGSMEL